jgi:hypothetical protein
VVEADVEQDRDLRPVERDRTVALVHFGHEHAAAADFGAGEGSVRGDEILHHRAVHDRGIASGLVHDPAEHAGYGRLAAGPANGDSAGRGVEQRRKQFGARHTRAAEFTGADDFGNRVLDRGRGDERLLPRDDAAAVLREQAEALGFEPGELLRRAALVAAAVGTGHVGAKPSQDRRQRQHS